jgi:ATP-binding cassette subfamily B protein
LGGILLAFQALRKLTAGLWNAVGAWVAWKQIAPIYHAAGRPTETPSALITTERPDEAEVRAKQPLLEAHDLVFRYRESGDPVLDRCSLRIAPGDRLLLDGISGGGKSTLASLLVGLRSPQSGLLFLNGLDRRSLGNEAWRRTVTAAPQFHENHVFTETFAFNLLMGRRWPPELEDMKEAEQVCHELGLNELLERMPAGLLQMVGETGWQLSHGEKSRLYIARAVLQQAEVMILDESFAALDPENLARSLRCVLERASTLLVIAHP